MVRTLVLFAVAVFSTFAGELFSRGTYFGQLVEVYYRSAEGRTAYSGTLVLPSGGVWSFDALDGKVVKFLAAFLRVDFVRPKERGPAFEGALTAYAAVGFEPVRRFELKKLFGLSKERRAALFERGYRFARGFWCGRVEKLELRKVKVGLFSQRRVRTAELALTNAFGLPAVENGRPLRRVAAVSLPFEENAPFETEEERKLYNLLRERMGRFVCVEYFQRKPEGESPLDFVIVGLYGVEKK
ncbi:MAG: hypothetical protein GXO08_01030 [Aquificae bacterium]|nr:hypothetical protein [Aquificota bacterium]